MADKERPALSPGSSIERCSLQEDFRTSLKYCKCDPPFGVPSACHGNPQLESGINTALAGVSSNTARHLAQFILVVNCFWSSLSTVNAVMRFLSSSSLSLNMFNVRFTGLLSLSLREVIYSQLYMQHLLRGVKVTARSFNYQTTSFVSASCCSCSEINSLIT